MLAVLLVTLVAVLLTADSSTGQTPSPLEAKRNQLMEKRFSDTLVALREPEDTKTLQLLSQMAQRFVFEMKELKPHYQQWYQSLSDEEKRKLFYASSNKRWMLLMQEIQADTLIQQRFRESQRLRQEYTRLQFLCDQAAELKQ